MDTKFGFPKVEQSIKKSFKKNILKSVIFLIMYDTIESVTSKKEEFDSLLGEEYTLKENVIQAKIQGKNDTNPEFTHKHIGYSYKSVDDTVGVNIEMDRVSFQIQGGVYENYEHFIGENKELIDKLLEVVGVTVLKRISIRKINLMGLNLKGENPIPIDQLHRGLNVSLLSNFYALPNKEKLVNGGVDLSYVEGDYYLNVSYGMISEGLPLTPLTNILLDIDAIYKTEYIPLTELYPTLSELNDEIFSVFVWAIGMDLKLYLLQS